MEWNPLWSHESNLFADCCLAVAGATPNLENPRFAADVRMNLLSSTVDKYQFINLLVIAELLQYRLNPQQDLQDQALY